MTTLQIIGAVVCVVLIGGAAAGIYVLEKLYPLDGESDQDWIDRQW